MFGVNAVLDVRQSWKLTKWEKIFSNWFFLLCQADWLLTGLATTYTGVTRVRVGSRSRDWMAITDTCYYGRAWKNLEHWPCILIRGEKILPRSCTSIHYFTNVIFCWVRSLMCRQKSLPGQIWTGWFSINITFCPHKGMDLAKIGISKIAYFVVFTLY